MSLDDEYKSINPKKYEQMAKETGERVKKYEEALKNDKGIVEKWFEPAFVTTDWKKMDLPKEWGDTELAKSDNWLVHQRSTQKTDYMPWILERYMPEKM
jgi:hypothetical protein